jgi:hypothetical protein
MGAHILDHGAIGPNAIVQQVAAQIPRPASLRQQAYVRL